MLVFYTLQGADGEDPQHPNAIQIRGTGPVMRSTILENLPFRKSKGKSYFHIRYKKAEGNSSGSYVWQELNGENRIPPYNGAVWVKILRVTGSAPASHSQAATHSSPRRQATKTAARSKRNVPSAPKPKPQQRRPAPPSINNATAGWSNVLESKPAEEEGPPVDLSNIEDIRNKLPADYNEKSERVQRALVKRVRKQEAATRKRMEERKKAEREAAAKQAAKEQAEKSVKDKVENWHKDSTGQAKGLWTLLCNLNNALWQPNRWQEVDSSQMLETKYVRRMYRRAMKTVHPDRLPAGATPEQLVSAQRITQALQEAWAIYAHKNNM